MMGTMMVVLGGTMMGTMMVVLGGAGLIILGAAAGVAKVLSSESASVRHLVWTVALGLLVAVPVIHVADVRIEVPVRTAWLQIREPVKGLGVPAAAVPNPDQPVPPTVEARPAGVGRLESGPAVTRRDEAQPVPVEPFDVDPMAVRAAAVPLAAVPLGEVPLTEFAPEDPGLLPPFRAQSFVQAARATPWAQGLALAWLLGAVVLLAVTFMSHLAACRLTRRKVYRASPTVSRRFAILADEIGIRPMPRLVVSPALQVPATWGLRRSTVVLPDGYEQWSADTIDRVLLHELAHVRRRDCVTYLTGEVARAVHWPNPLAWLAVLHQRAESERACDDLVLSRGVAPSDYADDLLRLVRAFTPGTSLPQAAMAMARPSSGLARRVRAVLDPAQSRRDLDRRMTRAVMMGALGTAFVLMSVTPVAAIPGQVEARVAEPRAASVTPVREPRTRLITPVQEPRTILVPPVDALSESVEIPALVPPVDLVTPAEPVGAPTAASAGGGELPLLDGLSSTIAPPPPVEPSSRLAPQEHCVFQGEGRRSTSHSSEDDRVRIRWETDGCRVDIDIEGEVEFASDDSGIVGMAPGSSFEIEERIGRDEHRVLVEGTRGGVERRFWVDGDETEWGPAAEAWMARILPEIFRHTTINAEPRLRRMLAEGGTTRVFQAVEEMHTDHVRGTYLELLLAATDLGEAEYVRVIDHAGGMESDHTSGELLLRVVEQAGLRSSFQDPLLRAAEGLESDHQKSRVLEVILESDLTAAQMDAVVRSAATIESDHNLGMVLVAVARSGRLGEVGREDFLNALESIESDHNHGLVVSAFLDAGPLTPDELSRVLEMTRGIESDHERGTLLRRVGMEYSLTGDQATAYLVSASALGSDHELAMTAQALTERRALSGTQLDLAFGIARRISSDHSRATTLQTILTRQDLTEAGIRTLLDVAAGIGSEHQLASTLEMVIEGTTLRPALIADVLETAGGIGGSHQLATVLMAIAERYSLDGAARVQYERLAEGLSRRDREQALAAVRR